MEMKRMIVATLVGVLAASAFAASAASGAVPEFGKCVPATEAKTGEYAGPKCVKPVAGNKGTYNWVPGPGAKPKFTSFAGPVKLETVGGVKIQCSSGTVNGEYTGAKTASATISVLGCVDIATEKLCQTNPAKAGEIEATGLQGELGFIVGGSTPKVGLQLKLATPLPFECRTGMEPPAPKVLEGSFIGQIAPLNIMRETLKAKYTAIGGKQVPEQFEGGPPSVLTLKDILASTSEQAGITIIGIEEKPKPLIIENEEPIEVKAK
jgi:hypothetical protein